MIAWEKKKKKNWNQQPVSFHMEIADLSYF